MQLGAGGVEHLLRLWGMQPESSKETQEPSSEMHQMLYTKLPQTAFLRNAPQFVHIAATRRDPSEMHQMLSLGAPLGTSELHQIRDPPEGAIFRPFEGSPNPSNL